MVPAIDEDSILTAEAYSYTLAERNASISAVSLLGDQTPRSSDISDKSTALAEYALARHAHSVRGLRARAARQ